MSTETNEQPTPAQPQAASTPDGPTPEASASPRPDATDPGPTQAEAPTEASEPKPAAPDPQPAEPPSDPQPDAEASPAAAATPTPEPPKKPATLIEQIEQAGRDAAPELEQLLSDGAAAIDQVVGASVDAAMGVVKQAAGKATEADSSNAEPSAGDDASSGGGGEPAELHHELRRGRISSIRGEDVFVDLTGDVGKLQGMVPLVQFDRPPRVGSIMDFVVDKIDESQGLMHLSREGAVSRSTWDQLQRGVAIDARVTKTNKGGLELEIVGGIKAFMPASQVDIHHVDDLEHFVGQKITAMVQEVDRRHKKVLLSRRAYLERQKQRQQRKTLAELEVGQEREGTVSNVTDFGAFVDLGGVDGLVHVTDLAYGHVGKPSDVVKKGDTVKVKVLKIDAEKQRIGLGIKQVQPDPWELAAPQLQPGEQVEGTVTKTANFGAFVQLDLGVEGLLPMSEISWRRINNAEQVVQPGQKIRVQVLEVDRKKQRLTLSLKQVAGDPWAGAGSKFERGQAVQGTVRTVTDFGAFVELEPGVEGLAHISELSDRRIGKVTDVLNVGDTKTFYIKDVKTDDRKLSLSLRDPAKFAKEQAAAGPRIKPRPKISKDKLKSGLGNTGAMGTGLGGLSLDDLK